MILSLFSSWAETLERIKMFASKNVSNINSWGQSQSHKFNQLCAFNHLVIFWYLRLVWTNTNTRTARTNLNIGVKLKKFNYNNIIVLYPFFAITIFWHITEMNSNYAHNHKLWTNGKCKETKQFQGHARSTATLSFCIVLSFFIYNFCIIHWRI